MHLAQGDERITIECADEVFDCRLRQGLGGCLRGTDLHCSRETRAGNETQCSLQKWTPHDRSGAGCTGSFVHRPRQVIRAIQEFSVLERLGSIPMMVAVYETGAYRAYSSFRAIIGSILVA